MELRFNPQRKFKITPAEIAKLPETIFLVEMDDEEDFDLEDNLTEDEKNALNVQFHLNRFLNPPSGIIDGDKVKQIIFPTRGKAFPSFDVFISHSHNNVEEAEKLAEYLRERNYTPFLDNYVWSSADGLLKKIDNKYSTTTNGKLYVYDKVLFSSSHVHTMLSMAILEMIARCESFIFIESTDSIDYKVLKRSGRRTQSPWLFQELQYVRMLSAVTRRRIGDQREFSDLNESLKISYGANLNDFTDLSYWNIDDEFPKKSERLL